MASITRLHPFALVGRCLMASAVAFLSLGGAAAGAVPSTDPPVTAPGAYTLTANATTMGPGQSITFSSNAPSEMYAEVFVECCTSTAGQGELSPVARGTVSQIVGTIAWEDYDYLHWYSCQGGRLAVRIYNITEADTYRYFSGILQWGQQLDGVTVNTDLTVTMLPSIDPNKCPTGSAGTSGGGLSPTTTNAGSLGVGTGSNTRAGSGAATTSMPRTGLDPTAPVMLAIVLTAFGVGTLRLSRRREQPAG